MSCKEMVVAIAPSAVSVYKQNVIDGLALWKIASLNVKAILLEGKTQHLD